MAWMQCQFFSRALEMQTSVYVIQPLPSESPDTPCRLPSPCLYLLHGISDDHSGWCRYTSIERYASSKGLTVVMPCVHRSFYTDMAHGHAYWTYVSEELPRLIRASFPVSTEPAQTYVAGLSMGGYGAFKLALRHPDRFRAAASLSGVMDVAARLEDPELEWRKDAALVFGPGKSARGTQDDLFMLAEQVARAGVALPAFYQVCGTEDFLYSDNLRFRDHATGLGLPLTYREGPGAHDWNYWDAQIQEVLNWLPLEGPERQQPSGHRSG